MATATLTRGLDRDQWLDRPTLATLMGKVEDTVRRIQRDENLPTRLGPNNCVLLRLGDLIDLGRIPAAVLDPEISAREVADAIALRAELEDLRRVHAELLGRHTEHEQLVTDLRAHLATQAAFIADLRATTAVAR
ncbi:hypothetical protein [Actinotalea solisilvae]|uniref:hypothetical protein n=1 Tax=Actinotalea solisilvae TaxID=2072922 RepID=UPI0018F14875|nr:hypothetical protein [Actinotalea solisilvae]